ncbi:MAG TPA: hypothetical protein VEA59_03170 [Patescibacteria group bacterium]|nr:hypothetical protein [Patescibacteria group bacterium]
MKKNLGYALLFAGVVFASFHAEEAKADRVRDDVNTSSISVPFGTPITLNYRIAASDTLPQGDIPNCNANNNNPVTVVINTAPGLTPSQNLLFYTQCGADQPVTFTANQAGSYIISVTTNGGKPGSLFDWIQATLLVEITDSTPPVIISTVTPAPNAAGWSNVNTSISWTVTDPESAVTLDGCNPFTLTTETLAATSACTATSAGGTASSSVTLKLDKTAPTVTVSGVTEGGVYTLGQVVPINWTASDLLSGIAANTGSTPNGTNIDTSSVGTKTITINVVDHAGNITTQIITYSVVQYNFVNVMSPLGGASSGIFGSPVLIRFKIVDTNGVSIPSASAQFYINPSVFSNGSPAKPGNTKNSGNNFAYNPTTSEYFYYVAANGNQLKKGVNKFRVILNDGTLHDILVNLK